TDDLRDARRERLIGSRREEARGLVQPTEGHRGQRGRAPDPRVERVGDDGFTEAPRRPRKRADGAAQLVSEPLARWRVGRAARIADETAQVLRLAHDLELE